MRVLVSGSTGFLGTSLIVALQREGHSVLRLVRPDSRQPDSSAAGESVRWDPVDDQFDSDSAEGADALVHLAGASIAGSRWTASRKNLIRTSRVDATRHLIGKLAKLKQPPLVVVGASAIGYYGNRGDEILTESSAPGHDFLSLDCRDWEAETARAENFGARAVSLRFGIILAAHGGALPRMALPFKLGVGGRLGSGRQWMSWLELAEAIRMIQFALSNAVLSGPVNAVTPTAVQNAEFTRILAKTLHRPALFPAPPFALRLALGEMADVLLLASQKVMPSKLTECGYAFLQPDLTNALRETLGKSN
jgi:uncharacterized protein